MGAGGKTAASRPRDLPAAGIDVADLVALLGSLDVADLSDADVLGVVAGWQQVASIAAAAQAAAIGELLARRPVSTSFPVDDVACALSTTGHGAAALVGRARGLADHPGLGDALRAGVLDPRKADVLLDEVARLPLPDAEHVLAAVLVDAEGCTAPLLRRRARRLVAAIDPDAAAKRADRSRADRCVRVEPVGDAMAWFSAFLPAHTAHGAFSAIDALARNARTADDDRTLDQRRADVFADVFDAILAAGVTPDGTALPTQQGAPVGLQLTLAATTLAGLDDMPGELTGYGPLPAPIARDLARRADRYRPILTDEAGHVLAVSDRTYPTTDLPLARGGPPGVAVPPGGAVPPGVTVPPGGAVRGAPAGIGNAEVEPPSPPGDQSPVTRSSGEPETAASVGYRPGASLTRLVVTRDQTCVFPGCRQPAAACDLDHVEPFDPSRPADAQTCAGNLQPLCRHHHLAKTRHGWSVHRDPTTGDTRTTSPTGMTIVRPAATIVLTQGAYDDLRHRAAPTPPDEDDPPF